MPDSPPAPLPPPVDSLSAGQARRIALAAQGLDRSLRSSGRIDARHLRR
ncbi:MAG: winged helix-turn-helix domain-containing protein, partial [Gammaproteobacteria bacterium]|nr:winged helix-turn-helix domain-containing protein [Gammaproteobacteria bacterium]